MANRRDFIKVSALGIGGLAMSASAFNILKGAVPQDLISKDSGPTKRARGDFQPIARYVSGNVQDGPILMKMARSSRSLEMRMTLIATDDYVPGEQVELVCITIRTGCTHH